MTENTENSEENFAKDIRALAAITKEIFQTEKFVQKEKLKSSLKVIVGTPSERPITKSRKFTW